MVLFGITFIQPVSSYDAPEGKEATWEVIEYDVDAFLYIDIGSKIKIDVINSSDSSVNVLLSSTDFVEDEPLIDYSSTRCYPFIVPTSFLNQSNSLFQQAQQREIFGVERTIVSLFISNTYIDDGSDGMKVDYVMDYDLETGLMIGWTIIQDFETASFRSVMNLTSTTFWEFEEPNILADFYHTNKFWILPMSILFGGTFGSYISYKVIKTRKSGIVKIQPKKKTPKKVKSPQPSVKNIGKTPVLVKKMRRSTLR